MQIAARIYDYTDEPTYGPVVDFGNWQGSSGGAAVAGKYVSGPISSNTTWQTSDGLVGVIGSLVVASNTALTIQPGVRVEFYGNLGLRVDGSLQALGTSNQPISFTSGDSFPLPGDWQGI